MVQRQEVLDYVTYENQRAAIRDAVIKKKEVRRIHLGPYLTFLFENHDTVRYQIQEMMRIEKIVKEKDIRHEIDTYNQILGDPGDLGCTLLIEFNDKAEREIKLKQLMGLPENIYLVLVNGKKVYATYDPGQVGTDRLSSVQYLKFGTEGIRPVAIGVEHRELMEEVILTSGQQNALAEDVRT
jgi:hypothetical protein